ncbi:MAG: T9SS type A sorting domain-containing protein [Saprospirales bacterium]|nr:T9SS type A sorting domain-containing protein [Saprospirales bacterium]
MQELKINNIYFNSNNSEIVINYFSEIEKAINISIYDLLGKSILTENSSVFNGNNQLVIPISGFSDGIYICQISTTKSNVVKKIIVNSK